MFGLGGILNRWRWSATGDEWYDDDVLDLMDDHREETGCPDVPIDWFDEYPDEYYCSWCGEEL